MGWVRVRVRVRMIGGWARWDGSNFKFFRT